MTGASIEEMYRLIDFLDELRVPKMNIGNTLPECSGRNWSRLIEYPDVVEIAERLTLYALTKRISFSFITPLPICLKRGRTISNPSVCSAGAYSLIVDTSGQFRPCSTWTLESDTYPNVHSVESLGEVHEQMRRIVQHYVKHQVPHDCRVCADLRECRAACPLYWQVTGINHPHSWDRISALSAPGPEVDRRVGDAHQTLGGDQATEPLPPGPVRVRSGPVGGLE